MHMRMRAVGVQRRNIGPFLRLMRPGLEHLEGPDLGDQLRLAGRDMRGKAEQKMRGVPVLRRPAPFIAPGLRNLAALLGGKPARVRIIRDGIAKDRLGLREQVIELRPQILRTMRPATIDLLDHRRVRSKRKAPKLRRPRRETQKPCPIRPPKAPPLRSQHVKIAKQGVDDASTGPGRKLSQFGAPAALPQTSGKASRPSDAAR